MLFTWINALGNAEKFFEMEVSLPIFYSLKEKDIKYVIRNIKTIIGVN